ncbi:hypothetical protein JL721_11419 [Aureococcus anophagefferens]|nr:hypothetical protein JL721_11419 [Aureococcus anophagefferens]
MIRGSVAVALGKALSTNHCVTHLNLAFNSLAEEGVVFGNSLLKNRVLKVLDLSNNGLGPKAAFAMSVALLGRMSALELLVMDGNPRASRRPGAPRAHAHGPPGPPEPADCSFHGGSIGERWIINDDYTPDLRAHFVAGATRDDAGGRFVVFDEATGEDFAQTLPEAGVLRLCFAKAVVKLGMDEPMTQAGVVGWATSLGAIQDVLQVAEAADNHLLAFIRAMLPKSTNRSRLQRAMGQRFQLLIDMPAGHYTLRLDKMEEREVLVALLQANRFERHRVVARAKRSLESGAFDENCFHYPYVDTSQHGNRSGFRNETLDGSAVEICDELLDGLGPSPKGLLEFDFVKMTPPLTAEPMTRALSQLLSVAAISDDVDDRCLQLAVEGAKTPREEKRPPRRAAPDGRGRSPGAAREPHLEDGPRPRRGLRRAHRRHGRRRRRRAQEDAADRAMRSTRMSKVAGPPGRPPGGEAAEDDGDKAAQDSLMEAQQKLAQAMPDVGKGGAAGGDHRRSTYKPRDARRKPATPDTDEPTPDGTPSATPKATTRSVGKKPASPALGGGSEMLRASSKSGKSKLNKLKTIARMMISARRGEIRGGHGADPGAPQRVELVIMLHSRIVDLYNIDEVFAVLDPTMRAEAIFRLGTLNIWSPLKPDGPARSTWGSRGPPARGLVHAHRPRGPNLAGVDEDDDDLLSEMPQSEPLEAMLAASLDAAHIKWVYDGITVADPVPRRPKDLPGGRDSLIQAKSRSATPEA